MVGGSQIFNDAANALLAAAPGLPTKADLTQELTDAIAAQKRGYYTPDEDERLRDSYHRYLAVRVALWDTVRDMLPYVDRKVDATDADHLRSFGIAFCAASMLVRTGQFLLDIAEGRDIVWQKLDEAEPRFGIERKTFTRIYKGLTSPKIIHKYRKSARFFKRNQGAILDAMDAAPFSDVRTLLETEVPLIENGLWDWIVWRLDFRRFSLNRRRISAYQKSLFTVFELSGSRIAELKQPFVKAAGAPKRVTNEVRAKVLEICQPGDVFVTRHDDALSNVFLPGFWPHAALYLGDSAQRKALGLPDIEPAKHHHADRIVFMESKKDGVLFRPVEDTLELDAFVILRPRLPDDVLRAALTRAMSHVGKLYDFSFDFSGADRLACTELVYRSYHGSGGHKFRLSEIAGRKCLSAEHLMDQLLGAAGFDVFALYGLCGNSWQFDAEARAALLASYEHKIPDT